MARFSLGQLKLSNNLSSAMSCRVAKSITPVSDLRSVLLFAKVDLSQPTSSRSDSSTSPEEMSTPSSMVLNAYLKTT